jgi:dUTP pyrophosphatase
MAQAIPMEWPHWAAEVVKGIGAHTVVACWNQIAASSLVFYYIRSRIIHQEDYVRNPAVFDSAYGVDGSTLDKRLDTHLNHANLRAARQDDDVSRTAGEPEFGVPFAEKYPESPFILLPTTKQLEAGETENPLAAEAVRLLDPEPDLVELPPLAEGSPVTVDPPLRLHRLDPALPLPRRAHPTDAGIDLYSAEDLTLDPGERALVGTGVAVALPAGTVGLVHPRSGLAAKKGLSIVNAPGTVDADYRGEVKVCLINLDRDTSVEITRGDRIAQLLVQAVSLCDVVEVDALDETERGASGHGSTGA